MSMTREDYIILGFDLSPYREQIYTDEWCTDENIDKWEYLSTKKAKYFRRKQVFF